MGTREVDTYAARGVSSGKEGLHKLIEKDDKGLYPTAFCKIMPDPHDDHDRCVVMHADGVGTKLALAFAFYKETGDERVWHGVVQDGIEMNLGDMLCVGDFTKILLSSTIGYNSKLVGDDILGAIIDGRRKIQEFCLENGLHLVSTGGETASVGDLVRTIDLNYTCFGSLGRKGVVDAGRIQSGDLIVGLASYGQASYEDRYNTGIGSNGLTDARHDIFSSAVGEKYPDTFSPQMPPEYVYRGRHQLTQTLPALGRSYGEALLSPTRMYLPVMKRVFNEIEIGLLHGIIHNTGGGVTKAKKFLRGVRAVKDSLIARPTIFDIIQSESGKPWEHMYSTYNMGQLLELYVPNEKCAQTIIHIARSFNIDANIIGYCEAMDGEDGEVLVKSPYGEFTYKK